MTTPSYIARVFIGSTLASDTEVAAKLGPRIYDKPPASKGVAAQPAYPWARIGEGLFLREDATCTDAGTLDVDIHVWSTDGGLAENQNICELIGKALHETRLDHSSGVVVEVEHRMNRCFTDADGLTSHGIVTVRALLEA
jgi:hypothetical protein